MSPGGDFTTLEVLGIAIKAEVEAISLYSRMKEKTKNPDLALKLEFLIGQERNHEKLLTEAYRKRFPDVDLALPPKPVVPAIADALAKEAGLRELFAVAKEAEKMAEAFYKDLAGKTRDHASKSTLEYLSSMEHSHYMILEAEYQQLQFSKDYDSDDFLRGERLMNLGP
jgi:rubrerythrin